MYELYAFLNKFEIVFWDFDGTIKETESVKADAFEKLFEIFGDDITGKIKSHHKLNGGISRYDKIPLYLEWVEEDVSNKNVEVYCKKFSNIIRDKVVNSPWVESVKLYIEHMYLYQSFVLVTATPHLEIQQILRSINFDRYFKCIYGYPHRKESSIYYYLKLNKTPPGSSVMVGDSVVDLSAARKNRIPFALRQSIYNQDIIFDGFKFS